MSRTFLLGSACLLLVSCTAAPSPEGDSLSSESSSVRSIDRVESFEGTLQRLGVSIIMQGTHRLFTEETAVPIVLQSAAIRLDDYVDLRVRVTGPVRPTTEGNAILMDVRTLTLVEAAASAPAVLEEDASSSSSAAIASSVHSTSPPIVSSSRSVAAPPPPASSSSAPTVSSTPPPVSSASSEDRATSSSVPDPSSSSSSVNRSAAVSQMARSSVSGTTFTTTYCTGHIGFCVPVHRNWFYQSFGATVDPYLWHVEFGNTAVENVGDGVIIVNLVSGAFTGAESTAEVHGEFVIAQKAWTGNRHVEISGPKELQIAVEYMARSITEYQAP